MRPLAALSVVLGVTVVGAPLPILSAAHNRLVQSRSEPQSIAATTPRRAPARVLINDNRTPAGTLHNGVLTLRLEAREGMWHPDADDAPGMLIQAFGEVGKRPQIPGPLIRVSAGTEIRVTVANAIPGSTLRVYGLHARADAGNVAGDTLLTIPTGETREVRFRLDLPGTYHYWGTTSDSRLNRRSRMDGQLSGAIVVDDSSTGPTSRDRIFVIGEWVDSLEANGAPVEGGLFVLVINGRSWPHTERLLHSVGDSVRWRWINTSPHHHPMHLHGFYYRIDSRGDGRVDTLYADSARPQVVTERIPVGGTMTMAWVPERPGNWLFHCHVPRHVEPHMPLDRTALHSGALHVHATNHTLHGMGGLVMGVHVQAQEDARAKVEPPRRRMRLVARVDTGGTAKEPAYGFTLTQGNERSPRQAGLLPGPVLILERGEPVAITVVNELPEPTAVHWHGIELESYFDGVAGFGGTPGRITPVIAPRDSFVARFTPPRAGTFIYHTHVDEKRQEPAGLSGVIVVREPGAHFDPATDSPVLISTPRRLADRRDRVYLNGSLTPRALEWRAGGRHRLRLVNMTIAPPSGLTVALLRDSSIASWRRVAKDGADLPASLARAQRAPVRITIGETHDLEVLAGAPGDYRLEVRLAADPGVLRGVLPIRVR